MFEAEMLVMWPSLGCESQDFACQLYVTFLV